MYSYWYKTDVDFATHKKNGGIYPTKASARNVLSIKLDSLYDYWYAVDDKVFTVVDEEEYLIAEMYENTVPIQKVISFFNGQLVQYPPKD